jgi:hypothetical protein
MILLQSRSNIWVIEIIEATLSKNGTGDLPKKIEEISMSLEMK